MLGQQQEILHIIDMRLGLALLRWSFLAVLLSNHPSSFLTLRRNTEPGSVKPYRYWVHEHSWHHHFPLGCCPMPIVDEKGPDCFLLRIRPLKDHGTLREESLPLLLFVTVDPSDASCKSTNAALPHLAITDLHFQSVPQRGTREMFKSDCGNSLLPLCVLVQGLKHAIPPSKRTANLHLPLELYSLAHFQSTRAPQHTIGIRAAYPWM